MSRIEVNVQTNEVTVDEDFVGQNFKEPNTDKLKQIRALEAEITQRRLRDAILGNDGGWLVGKEAEIAAIRDTL